MSYGYGALSPVMCTPRNLTYYPLHYCRGHARLQLNHQVCRRHYSGGVDYNKETAYRYEVRANGVWCQENNLTLNVNKTKEMIVDFKKQQREQLPIHVDGTVVEKLESFKFLHVHITDKLKWSTHTDSVVKKALQRLFNLKRLKKFGLSPKTHKLLQMHNLEHPVGLYHRLVRQLLHPQP